MGAVRMRVQTTDKNITIIHTTPVHQLTSCEVKNCMLVRNQSIKTCISTSNWCFWLKAECCVHNFAISCVNQGRYMHRSSTVYKKTVLNKYVGGFWCERTTGHGVIMDYGILARNNGFKHLDGFVSYKNVAFHFTMLTMVWSGVDYCDVFISCLDSHSDGTHSLQRIHWLASDAKFLKICSNEEINSSISWMTWGWEHFQQTFIQIRDVNFRSFS